MAFKIKSTEVITNNSEIKGKRAAGRLGKVIYDPATDANLLGFDVSTGNYFVIDYEEIVTNANYIAAGDSTIILYVTNRPTSGGDNNQVPGDYPQPSDNLIAAGVSDGWEFTLLIKNLWSQKEGITHSDIIGSTSYFYYNVENPAQSAAFADTTRIGTSNGDANITRDLKMRYGSDVIFKIMKQANNYPGGGQFDLGSWRRRWVAFPMMRNLF